MDASAIAASCGPSFEAVASLVAASSSDELAGVGLRDPGVLAGVRSACASGSAVNAANNAASSFGSVVAVFDASSADVLLFAATAFASFGDDDAEDDDGSVDAPSRRAAKSNADPVGSDDDDDALAGGGGPPAARV